MELEQMGMTNDQFLEVIQMVIELAKRCNNIEDLIEALENVKDSKK